MEQFILDCCFASMLCTRMCCILNLLCYSFPLSKLIEKQNLIARIQDGIVAHNKGTHTLGANNGECEAQTVKHWTSHQTEHHKHWNTTDLPRRNKFITRLRIRQTTLLQNQGTPSTQIDHHAVPTETSSKLTRSTSTA